MKIGRYKIRKLVGQGSMGKVYVAIDPKLNREVALKLLRAGITDPKLQDRFRLEARAIAALKHPNIVQLYDYSSSEETQLYLVMEYVKGPSLHTLLAKHGVMSEVTALCVGYELCQALMHAHENKVVHRDLKPENVLLSDGRIVLTDFGIVKAIESDNSIGVRTVATRTQVLGTPGFMAPEQFLGEKIDYRTDVFAVGALLFNLVTCELPYEGSDIHGIYKNVKSGRVRDPQDFNPVVSEPYCNIVKRCMQRDPNKRPQSIKELLGEISQALKRVGADDVREELRAFQENPARHSVLQRERGVEVLLRDLKVATKDRDDVRARSILAQIREVAPLEDRMGDISGVIVDPRRGAMLESEYERSRRWAWIGLGFMVGFGLGAVAASVVILFDLLPDIWRAWVW